MEIDEDQTSIGRMESDENFLFTSSSRKEQQSVSSSNNYPERHGFRKELPDLRSLPSTNKNEKAQLLSTSGEEREFSDDSFRSLISSEILSDEQLPDKPFDNLISYDIATKSIQETLETFVPTPQPLRDSNNMATKSKWTMRFYDGSAEQAMNNTKSNVTASIGGPAFLPCRVGHLGDRQISWIRSRDWHVLTSGKVLYTHDKRFSMLHEPGSQDWILHIRWVDMKDEGSYECQVSTGTGIISMFTYLQVVAPEAHIPGQGQYHVNKGSPVTINCFIHNSPSPPQYIFWHHNGKLINFIRNHPEIIITSNLDQFQRTVTNNMGSTNISSFFSRLHVDEAEEFHSGNYTCTAPNIHSSSTQVFVTEGDKTAAVQRIDSGVQATEFSMILIGICISLSNS